jgi:hypothetical protein
VADVARTRVIAAAPKQIWDVLADFGAISSWADNIDHSCILVRASAPVGCGSSRIRLHRCGSGYPAHVGSNFEGLVVRVDDATGGEGHLWKLVRTFDDPATWTS